MLYLQCAQQGRKRLWDLESGLGFFGREILVKGLGQSMRMENQVEGKNMQKDLVTGLI